MHYAIGKESVAYSCHNERRYGSDEVLLEKGTDLTRRCDWHLDGFTVAPLLPHEQWSLLQQGCSDYLKSVLMSLTSIAPDFSLAQYHRYIGDDQDLHLSIIDRVKVQPVSAFPLDMKHIEERISEICHIPLEARNPFDNARIYHYRIVRPNVGDNNPLHRDIWLEDYDDCINLYIPIVGSNALSSLPLIPGSHLWPESCIEKTVGGAHIGNVRFNVPAVTSIDRAYEVSRPEPKANEVLVFSPYLIHGGAVNLNQDITRVSLEIRLWKK